MTRAQLRLPGKRWTDDFNRPNDTHIGNGWINGHDTHPTMFDPLGVRDGAAYCPDPLARVPVEDYEPEDEVDHPPAEGKASAAIGYTARETPEWWLPDIEVIRYGMNWANPSISPLNGPPWDYGPPWDTRHIELTPLLHIDPANPKGGFGVWPSVWDVGVEVSQGWFIVATIGSPPELFSQPESPVIASGAFDGHSNRDEQSLRIKCTEPGKAIIIHNDRQVDIIGYGLEPVGIPVDLLHSRMMGFAFDAHFVRPYSKIPNYPVCARITFHGLGSKDLEL